MTTRLNNPGGGDCLYYSIAAGLIEAIQNSTENQGRALWERWEKKGNINDVTFEQIKGVDLNNEPFEKHKEMMSKLLISLRHICAENLKKEFNYSLLTKHENAAEQIKLNDNIRDNKKYIKSSLINEEERRKVSNQILDDEHDYYFLAFQGEEIISMIQRSFEPVIMAMHEKNQNSHGFDKYDVLNKSPEVVNLANEAIEYISENELNGKDRKLYISNLIKDNQELFRKAIDIVKMPGQVWGDYEHANSILRALKVNKKYNSYVNIEQSGHEDNFFEGAPVITLNNENNGHWTTQISENPRQILNNPRIDSYTNMNNKFENKKVKKAKVKSIKEMYDELTSKENLSAIKIDEEDDKRRKGETDEEYHERLVRKYKNEPMKANDIFAKQLQQEEIDLYEEEQGISNKFQP